MTHRLLPWAALTLALMSTSALAKLPPPNEAQQAKAAEAKARAAWTDKVAAYQLCRAQDKAAAHYFETMKAQGRTVPGAMPAAACADPGPFVAPAAPVAAATAPAGAPSEPKPAVSPAGQALQSPRQTP
ncbi:hypothetical protein [Cupriavidus campinensis]